MLDFWAVYCKECKELFSQGSKQTIMRLLLVLLGGIWIPFQAGILWLQLSLPSILFLSIFPMFIGVSLIADLLAGERERHTLETLLASRLSNWSIVIGKATCIVTLSWGITLISLVLGFVVANMSNGGGHTWTFYPLDLLLAVTILSLTTSVLITFIGVLFSMHAATVRQVQQMLSFGTIIFFAVAGFLVIQLIDQPFIKPLLAMNSTELLSIVTASIAIIDIILMLVSLARFQRSRLILD